MKKIDMRTKFSLLWIFAMFNYLYADVLTLMDPSVLKQMLTGTVDGLQITQGLMLVMSIMMETAIAMIVLSRVLKYKANRRANIIVGAIHTVAVFASMFVGTPAPYYIFFGTVEIATTSFIIWSAWKWPKPKFSSR